MAKDKRSDWLPSMRTRSDDGFVRLDRTQSPIGGHGYLRNGHDQRRGAIHCVNSWRDWGGFWLAAEDAEFLLLRDGECCSPTEASHRTPVRS